MATELYMWVFYLANDTQDNISTGERYEYFGDKLAVM